ncbi:MAG: hypothetical protein GY906_22845 [bacterium]|nr:hypothetical protein [bacterium]
MKGNDLLVLALFAAGGWFVFREYQRQQALKAGAIAQQAVRESGFFI